MAYDVQSANRALRYAATNAGAGDRRSVGRRPVSRPRENILR
jgi:hypothetical protein